MGYRRAVEAATTMTEFAGLEAALHYHLTANHYPPVPAAMVPVAAEAIRLAAAGAYDHEVELPDGVTYKDGSSEVPVDTLIESLHLEPFVEEAA